MGRGEVPEETQILLPMEARDQGAGETVGTQGTKCEKALTAQVQNAGWHGWGRFLAVCVCVHGNIHTTKIYH